MWRGVLLYIGGHLSAMALQAGLTTNNNQRVGDWDFLWVGEGVVKNLGAVVAIPRR